MLEGLREHEVRSNPTVNAKKYDRTTVRSANAGRIARARSAKQSYGKCKIDTYYACREPRRAAPARKRLR